MVLTVNSSFLVTSRGVYRRVGPQSQRALSRKPLTSRGVAGPRTMNFVPNGQASGFETHLFAGLPPAGYRISLSNTESTAFLPSFHPRYGARLSVPVTEPAEPNTPLLRFQIIDKLVPHIKHYKCHLKDKDKFRRLHNNENNMLARSKLDFSSTIGWPQREKKKCL